MKFSKKSAKDIYKSTVLYQKYVNETYKLLIFADTHKIYLKNSATTADFFTFILSTLNFMLFNNEKEVRFYLKYVLI